MNHVVCSECRWGGELTESRTPGACPNCGTRYDFDTPPPKPRTHAQYPSSASSACGLDFVTLTYRKEYHTLAAPGETPTCTACERYAALRAVTDRQAESLRKVLAIYLPHRKSEILTWEALLDDLDAELGSVEVEVEAEVRLLLGEKPS